jgi:benzoyl-CoA reductase/2-hydroxyglutaryl-CoA dehydratase subunit BcrC/BadD/HgdB
MSALQRLVDDALHDPFATARAHAEAGGRVVGYVGSEIPVELIIASGAFPLRVPSFADAGTALADRYLESSFLPGVRSIAEQYLQGSLDFLHAIILSRSDDSSQRLYYYLSEMRSRGLSGGPEPLIYDLSKIPRDTSLAHSRWATRRLASEIGADERALSAAIAKRNRRRELFAAAAQARMGAGRIRGSAMERMFRAADLCDADVFDAALREWLKGAKGEVAGLRVLLTGNVPPDERLHRVVEEAGGNVVAELGSHASCAVALPPIAPDGSFAAIAAHYQSIESGPRAFVDRGLLLKTRAQSAQAEAVIIWLIEQEDALIWELPAQLSALSAAGIAALPLVRRRWDASDEAPAEIASFIRDLEGST